MGKTSFDESTFAKLYLPILGKTAFTLYGLLRSLSEAKFSILLEYLNIGQTRLETAFDKLSAMSLIKIYEQSSKFQILLKSPKNFEDFLADELFKQLLVSKIGESQVKRFMTQQPDGLDISKKFFEVFELSEESFDSSLKLSSTEPLETSVKPDLLDIASFKQLMANKGYRFADESNDIIHLYSMAEKFSLDWYALFKLAEETANADYTFNSAAMIRKQIALSEPLPKVDEGFAELVRVAKAMAPQDFLTQLKRQVGGFVDNNELKLLSNFSNQKILPEVQNILIHYALIQQGNPSLTANFVNRIANDWMRHKVMTAEAAIERINNFEAKAKAPRNTKKSVPVKAEPKWSNPDYHEVASDDEVAEFKKQLDNLEKG
jgi:replication initiation and membrane attachment protein